MPKTNSQAHAKDAASRTRAVQFVVKNCHMRRKAARSQNSSTPHTAAPMLNTSTPPAAISFTTPAVRYLSGEGRSTVRSRLELMSSSASTPPTMMVIRQYSVRLKS